MSLSCLGTIERYSAARAWLLPLAVVSLSLGACGDQQSGKDQASAGAATTTPAEASQSAEQQSVEETLRQQLATARSGDVIRIPAGTHHISRGLVMNASGVTIEGAGSGRGDNDTILSFKNQIAGAEGLLLAGSNLTVTNLAIEDAKGDALKITDGRNIVVRAVRTEWTGGPSTDNGAYGIYPVQTENLLVEDSVAIAASDAGIYVGQSKNIVVRNNIARDNVAGIEIENSTRADVYGNLTENNTGGILVFNMPDIPLKGSHTRVYDNDIRANNLANFGAPGTPVSGVPAGSGVIINSNDNVEIFKNRIANNATANIVISSYFSANYSNQLKMAPEFDPYPESIYVYDNQFAPGGQKPGFPELEQLRVAMFGEDGAFPDVIWDGALNPELAVSGSLPAGQGICINNGEAACAPQTEMQVQRFEPGQYPTLLSEWQLLTHEIAEEGRKLRRASDTLVYSINTPLFADYTSKLRTISLPQGTQATYSEHAVLNFPVGTVISKTFYYDTRDVPLSESASNRPALFSQDVTKSLDTATTRLLETRLLVHTDKGWQALPYIWNDAQTDAVLSLTGAIKSIGDNIYVVPSKDECASCHALGRDKMLHPIGPKARHLHSARDTEEPQNTSSLQALVDRGWLAMPVAMDSIKSNANWQNGVSLERFSDTELEHRARSYLDANCGHCHNPEGSADTSHLYLDYANHSARAMGECKPPIAAGRGTGGNLYSIVPGDPEHSIISYRMSSTNPGRMMPEIGRTRVHTEGVALIDEWIRRQDGECN